MKIKILFLLLLSIVITSCTENIGVSVPEFQGGGSIANSVTLDDSIKIKMEGVYTIESGSDYFGKNVVGKWNGNTFSIFTGRSFAYFVLKGGRIDSNIVLEGYWRYAQDISTGLTQLKIDAAEGARELLQGKNANIIFRGNFGDGNSTPRQALVLKYVRPLLESKRPFYIIAHRAGGRNSDAIPESENSLGLIQLAEGFGANGIEIDVRLTKDGVPIIFHDENLGPRLIKGEFLIGPIANYPFAHLRALCTLKNGEPIPKLTEALETVIDKTTLSLVWLDIKVPEAIPAAIEIQKEYMLRAANAGRKVEFLIGIGTEEILSAFLSHPLHQTAPCLCELTLENVRQTNSTVWAPAWTQGTLRTEVTAMQNEGRRAFFWTLDGPEFIQIFLKEGVLDGILSNYPSIVAYEYYMKN